ncbi:MAG TPA: hemolysin family protein [Pyrinomonadaceae bacterium]|jgi:CBS domain containing-hemolysin-like protein|nr:hemolysin family protein [Pyrinomonadaceae bacterium]
MLTVAGLFAVLLLVLANGFFVASEFALVGVRRSRIATLAQTGDARAVRLLGLVDSLNAYISATQLGITLASLGLGWLGEPAIAHLLEKAPYIDRLPVALMETLAFGIAFTIITFLHIVIGELAPKTMALERAEKVALAIAWPMELFYKTFRLPIRILDWAGTRTVRLFGLHPSVDHASIYTADELRQLVDISTKSGHLEAGDQKLINRVFDFADAEVREAMVPRTALAALPVTATLEEAEKAFCELGYSRLPVYRERLDDIVGVLFLKDLVPCLRRARPEGFEVEKLLHPPMFVPATARLGQVLAQMQSARTHLSFVIDEHGGIEGIVTLEDLLEEIVGEINDEYDEEVRAQIVEDNGTYLLDGMLAVRDANRRFNLRLPEEGGYTTLAGFLLSKAGRLLRQGESVEHDGARFTVERVDRRRIRRIRFTPLSNVASSAFALLLPWLFCA